MRFIDSVHKGDDAAGHALAILVPSSSILQGRLISAKSCQAKSLAYLGTALVFVTTLTVPQEDGKVDGVEVRDRRGKACRAA